MSKNIMIVDDSAMVRMWVKRALTGEGFDVTEAVDGQDACEKLSAAVDFIICDVNMPRMSGIEFLEKLADGSAGAKPPIMMLTTEAEPDLIRRARQMGAVGWMVKPCQPEALIEAVQRVVS